MSEQIIAAVLRNHANRPPADAMAWAERFCEYAADNPAIATDPGTMVGWFANALENAELPPPKERRDT